MGEKWQTTREDNKETREKKEDILKLRSCETRNEIKTIFRYQQKTIVKWTQFQKKSLGG